MPPKSAVKSRYMNVKDEPARAKPKIVTFPVRIQSTREQLVQKAHIAEHAERFDDMARFMREVVTLTPYGKILSHEERNLLNVAYKNAIGTRRTSVRIITNIEDQATSEERRLLIITNYKQVIEKEQRDYCGEVISLIDEYLMKHVAECDDKEAKIFYMKMKADYLRYKSEVSHIDQTADIIRKAEQAYVEAQKAAASLAPTNPVRLGLALNLSVFYYEVAKAPNKAINAAKKAFDEAISGLSTLPEQSYQDSTTIIQVLQDNLQIWQGDKDANDK